MLTIRVWWSRVLCFTYSVFAQRSRGATGKRVAHSTRLGTCKAYMNICSIWCLIRRAIPFNLTRYIALIRMPDTHTLRGNRKQQTRPVHYRRIVEADHIWKFKVVSIWLTSSSLCVCQRWCVFVGLLLLEIMPAALVRIVSIRKRARIQYISKPNPMRMAYINSLSTINIYLSKNSFE